MSGQRIQTGNTGRTSSTTGPGTSYCVAGADIGATVAVNKVAIKSDQPGEVQPLELFPVDLIHGLSIVITRESG